MPAVRPGGGGGVSGGRGLVEHLQEQAPRKEVNQSIALRHYLHSADLLVAQAAQYRACGNEEQLYVMLMRLASLVIETVPAHRDFSKDSPAYRRWQRYVSDSALPEASRLKTALRTRDAGDRRQLQLQQQQQQLQQQHQQHQQNNGSNNPSAPPLPPADWRAPVARSTYAGGGGRRPEGAVPLASSALPEADWTRAGTPAAEAPGAGPEAAREAALGFPWPADAGAAGAGAAGAAATSQRTLDRHALFSRPAPRPSGQQAAGAAAAAAAAAAGSGGGSGQAAALALRGRYPSVGAPDGGAAVAAAMAAAAATGRPSAGLLPPPVQVPVGLMDPAFGAPGGTCSDGGGGVGGHYHQQQPLPLPPLPASSASAGAAGGASSLQHPSRRADLRDVHVSIALMNDFLALAASNTRRGIETCAILAGRLSANDSLFAVTALIIPKQEGTTDTVCALGEEEIYEAQSERELYPLGWIHTHPTQTCFLSSVDVHTQCGYQTMLDEAVAVVMAPTDARSRCGIFRLSTPGGLGLVQKCPQRGFHAHPQTPTGQALYELCGHVYVNAGVSHEVIDLR